MSLQSSVVAIAPNGGDWRSKSLTLPLKFSTMLKGFYFANCVLGDALFENLISNNKYKKQ
jgi:hypothetical protein